MNKSSLCIALAAACALPGSAFALTNTPSIDALIALPAVDVSWVVDQQWTSIDSAQQGILHDTEWDSPVTSLSDPCGGNWAGIYCDAEDDDITHIEIPNAKMNGTLASVFAALAPIKAQLISINLSSTEFDDRNVLTGPIPADGTAIGYTNLRYLGLNFVGADGVIPDMSTNSALRVANFYDNDFTQLAGSIGGTDLQYLGLHGNDGMTGDLSGITAVALGLRTMSSGGTELSGGLNGVENVTAELGVAAGSLIVSWRAPSEGLDPSSYSVEISNDGGETWGEPLPAVTAPDTTADATGLGNGTYIARVTPKANAELIGSELVESNEVVISSGSTDTTGGGSTSSSGGGAALWLLALPLLGFARRSR